MARIGRGVKQPASVPKPKALPRFPRPRVARYGPQRMFQIEDAHDALERRAAPDPTPQGSGTVHERIVYKELQRRGIPFDFQSSIDGGRTRKGGKIVDFLLLDRPIGIEVKGWFWHTELTRDIGREIQVSDVIHAYIVTIWDYEIEDEQEFQRIMDERVVNVLPTMGMMEGGVALMPAQTNADELKALREAVDDATRRVKELEDALFGGVHKPFKIDSATILGITAEQIATGTLQAATEINAGYRIGGGVTMSGDGSIQARTLEGVPFFVADGENHYCKLGLLPEESENKGDYIQLLDDDLTGVITSLIVRETLEATDFTTHDIRYTEAWPFPDDPLVTHYGDQSFSTGTRALYLSDTALDVAEYDEDVEAVIAAVSLRYGEDERGIVFADVEAGRDGQVAYLTTGIDIDNCEDEFVLVDLTINSGDRGAIQFIDGTGWKFWYDQDAAYYDTPWWQPAYSMGPDFTIDNVSRMTSWIVESAPPGGEAVYSIPWALHPDVCYLKSRVGIGFGYAGTVATGDVNLTWDGFNAAPLPFPNTDRDSQNYVMSVKVVCDSAVTRNFSVRDSTGTEVVQVALASATSGSWAANINAGIAPRVITGNTVQVVAKAAAGQPVNPRVLVGVA